MSRLRLVCSAVAVVLFGSIIGCSGASTAPDNSAPASSSATDQGSDSKDTSQTEKESAGSDSR
jgi:hypothetical protein